MSCKCLFYLVILHIFNRPNVARAVLQTPLSFINSLIYQLIHPYLYLQNTESRKLYELGS